MSDPEKSGAPNQGLADLSAPVPAPTEAARAPAPTPTPATPAPVPGSFGTTRGSGLARGKRPTPPAPPTASVTPVAYKPSAVEVITPPTEYRNPFTGETSVTTPRPNEPAPPPVPPVSEDPAPSGTHSPVPESSASLDAAARSDGPRSVGQTPQPNAISEASGNPKPELNILPPEPARRPALRWEAGSSGERTEERRTFQPSRERRENRSFDPRDRHVGERGRDHQRGSERRERGGERRTEARQHQDRAPRPEPAKKSGGFIGWLKGLFGGKSEAPAAQPEQLHDHNRRGGRGRGASGGGQGGFRGERGPQPAQGGANRPEGEHGGGQRRRRRRRGGRGRHRGEGGDPRPEGQQGGGAI